MPLRPNLAVPLILALALPAPLRAQDSVELGELEVRERAPTTAASSDTVRARDLELRPVRTPSDLLQIVPCLVTAQHAGGGKGEQIFLRGFDCDHGTDVAVFVEDVPVNVRSHAHGQGYADMHFIIPELVENVEVRKGPYFAELGDFATAGAARFRLRRTVKEDFAFVQAGAGSFGTRRLVAGVSPSRTGRVRSLLGLERYFTDGPFRNALDMERTNVLGRVGIDLGPSLELDAWASAMSSEWNASGQIPLREVEAGRLDRFGSIDPSEGGNTERQNLQLGLDWTGDASETLLHLWVSRYKLELFSNFTFDTGGTGDNRADGIVQEDDRTFYGLRLVHHRFLDAAAVPGRFTAGLDARSDDADVLLGTRLGRTKIGATWDGRVKESSVGFFAEAEQRWGPQLRTVLGLRTENFDYEVRVAATPAGFPVRRPGKREGLVLPKASLVLGPFDATEVYLNYGRGFHSNDARAVAAQPDLETLPAADGWELGFRARAYGRLDLAASAFVLDLGNEEVFVGDAGETEPSGATRRFGLEVEARLQAADWLWLDADLAFVEGFDRKTHEAIPLAPTFVGRGGATVRKGPWSGSLECRSVGDRPAEADPAKALVAQGYTIWNLVARYSPRGSWELFCRADNVFDAEWREAQHQFDSRLTGEGASVTDIHFNPGNPRSFELGLAYRF